jgi:hypothetical protein
LYSYLSGSTTAGWRFGGEASANLLRGGDLLVLQMNMKCIRGMAKLHEQYYFLERNSVLKFETNGKGE